MVLWCRSVWDGGLSACSLGCVDPPPERRSELVSSSGMEGLWPLPRISVTRVCQTLFKHILKSAIEKKNPAQNQEQREFSDLRSWLLNTSSSSSFLLLRCRRGCLKKNNRWNHLHRSYCSLWPVGGRHGVSSEWWTQDLIHRWSGFSSLQHQLSFTTCRDTPDPSKSLGTKDFLFSSRNWLGISPVAPPTTWRAWRDDTHLDIWQLNDL